MHALENYRIGTQEEIDQPIDERHVEGDEKHDGLGDEQSDRTRKVMVDELFEVDLDLFLFGVDGEILRLSSETACFDYQNGWRVRFNQEQGESEAEPTHDARNVHCPSPAQMGIVDDKSSDKRTREWTDKNTHCKCRDCKSSRGVVI